MKIEVKIPEVGESVQEAVLAQWFRKDGERVAKDELLFVIETDKVTLEIAAEADGRLQVLVAEGETVPIGAVVAIIETEAGGVEGPAPTAPKGLDRTAEKAPLVTAAEPQETKQAAASVEPAAEGPTARPLPAERKASAERTLSPAVRRIVEENKVDVSRVVGTGPGGRITKADVLQHVDEAQAAAEAPARETESLVAPYPEAGQPEAPETGAVPTADEPFTRKAMTPIRRKIAERLLNARQNTAMLTTFNEIDISRVLDIRRQFKQLFREKYGVSLGLMSFFIKASIVALKEFPAVNAFIEEGDIVYHHYYHIGVAIGAERGLVVPVLRHADRLSFAQVERSILDFVDKIQHNRLEIADLEGGTFTISNGGVYGSLLSTPILNTPQSGILGMHKIEDRPVVVNGEIVVRPMMYVALSYDHRIVDGREAVSFLKRIKDCIENPERIMMEV